MSFENASVIITGGSKGIGLSIAKVFSRKTSRRLILISRNYEELKKAKEECLAEGAKGVEVLAADITQPEQLKEMDFSSLNPGILVNNAGSFLFKPLSETSEEEFISQFQINALGAFTVTRAVLPSLKAQERAMIVNISSRGGLFGYAASGAYAMSKHALLGFSRSLREELKPTNIAVTAINLGQTYSTSWEGIDVDRTKLIDPEDVGNLIISLSQLSMQSVAEEISLMPQGGEIDPN
ncbi:MAG: SDR family oxidoreductase [Balneolales bacterium]|nr:SDR family oxidoreductase [Balneolales bacterium]